MRIIEAGEQMLIFERSDDYSRLRCSFNLSDHPVDFTRSGQELIATGLIDETSLGPYAGIVEELE